MTVTAAAAPAPQVLEPQGAHMSSLMALGKRLHLPAWHQVHCVIPKEPPHVPMGQVSQAEAPSAAL